MPRTNMTMVWYILMHISIWNGIDANVETSVDCFAQNEPSVVSARTFLSQLP